jgi:O-antigen/teichoic acid export membrane protein
MTSDLVKVAEDSARGSFFLISGSFVTAVIHAITSIMVGRVLGPEIFGKYTLSLVIPEMLFVFADFGIAAGVVRFAAGLRAEGKVGDATRIIKHAILFKALTGFVFFLVNFALADFLAAVLLNRPDLGFFVRVLSMSILFRVMFNVTTFAYLGLDKAQYSALISNVEAIAKLVISIGLILFGFGLTGAVLGFLGGYTIGGVFALGILLLFLRRYAKNSEDGVGFAASCKTLLSYGIPLYMSAIMLGFVHAYQNSILAIFTTNVEIGNLKAATNFISVLAVVSVPITNALLPAFSKLGSGTNKNTPKFFLFVNKYTTLLMLPLATLFMIFSREIVQIVYGSTYQTAALFLSIYCLLYFLVGVGYLNLKSLFYGLGETRIALKTGIITLLTVLVLTPFLVKAYGVPGAITAFISAQLLSTSYGMYFAKRNLKIKLDTRALFKTYLVAGVSAVPSLLLLQVSVFPGLIKVLVGGLFYVATYITLIPIARIISRFELMTITEVVQRIEPLGLFIKPLLKYQEKILNL